MAQTTGGTSFRNVALEYSVGATLWTDISGALNAIDVSGGDRKSGEAYTAVGETPIVTFGKKEPIELTAKVVYTEVTTEAYLLALTAKNAGTEWYLRWAPKGTATGNYRYTTGVGQVTSCTEPAGDVGNGEPVLVSWKFRCAAITPAAIS